MTREPQLQAPVPGALYRDLDGQLIRLIKISQDLCAWTPLTESGKTVQVTHRDNFVRRFTRFTKPLDKIAA